METKDYIIKDFLEALSSKSPAPGGGGAAALAGALGVSLASMVCELTIGKKKYAAVECDMKRLSAKAAAVRDRLLELADEDKEAFLSLSSAYSMPKDDTKERDAAIQQALVGAAKVPLLVMRLCNQEAAALFEEALEKGNPLAVSDVGVGALLLSAAVESAALNVFINLKSMKDKDLADGLRKETEAILESITLRLAKVSKAVEERVSG